jgi:hypothetical protein
MPIRGTITQVLAGIERVMAASGSSGQGISKFEARGKAVFLPESTPDLGCNPSVF